MEQEWATTQTPETSMHPHPIETQEPHELS